MSTPLATLVETYRDRAGARRHASAVVGYVGADTPVELLTAAGLHPFRLYGDPAGDHTAGDTYLGRGLDPAARSILTGLLAGAYGPLDLVVVSRDCEASLRLFYALRELRRTEPALGLPEAYLVDLLHLPHHTTTRYNRVRLAELRDRLAAWTGRPLADADIVAAAARHDAQRALLAEVATRLRQPAPPRLTGAEFLAVAGAGTVLPVDAHSALLRALLAGADALPAHPGPRVHLTGSAHDTAHVYEAVEATGAVIVGEDHDWGDPLHQQPVGDPTPDPLTALAERYQDRGPAAPRATVAARASHTARAAAARRADLLLAYARVGDEAPPWDFAAQRAAAGLPTVIRERQPYGAIDDPAALAAVPAGGEAGDEASDGWTRPESAQRSPATSRATAPPESAHPTTTAPRAAPEPGRGGRTAKVLETAVEAGRYQREWFAELRERVAAGEPFAVVNADAPQEILRAMDIPYVVTQWWSSVVAAKRQARRALDLVRERGYPDYTEQYNSVALGTGFDPDGDGWAWGGLPRPTIVLGDATGDVTRKILDVWGREPGVTYFALESAAENEVPANWWELMPHRWEAAVGSARLDLLAGELAGLVRFLETTTGRRFSERRFRRVLELVNEQEEWNLRARDLIARTAPAPLSVVDSIPSVMVPQWHRGTEWGRDAARRFHDEVTARVAAGAAACPGEQLRLMWIGRGLWHDMGLYQRFQESHGAVFVWSMYLAIAADGYRRYGGSPMRQLAARFAAFTDQLYTPPWSTGWYVKEARSHGIDGVVHLVSDDPRGSWFTTRALERAGFPVFELHADNVDAAGYDGGAALGEWLAGLSR